MSLREAAEKALEALTYAWHEDEAHPESKAIIGALRDALAEAEKAEPVSEDPMIEAAWKRFTAELENPSPLTDEEILEIWSPSLDGSVQRPILGKNKILAFARAVLAYAANAAARGKG